MVYQQDTLQVNSTITISLRCVESMGIPVGSDLVVDILKDDLQLDVVMISGKEYSVSMRFLQEIKPYLKNTEKSELRAAIYDRWIHLLGK